MVRSRMIFLLTNVAVACYTVGIIWAHEIDIFRTWKFLDLATFRAVQMAHWKKLRLICQLLSLALTAAMWGRWQAALSTDPVGAQGPFLAKILGTHWIRTALINAYALILFA